MPLGHALHRLVQLRAPPQRDPLRHTGRAPLWTRGVGPLPAPPSLPTRSQAAPRAMVSTHPELDACWHRGPQPRTAARHACMITTGDISLDAHRGTEVSPMSWHCTVLVRQSSNGCSEATGNRRATSPRRAPTVARWCPVRTDPTPLSLIDQKRRSVRTFWECPDHGVVGPDPALPMPCMMIRGKRSRTPSRAKRWPSAHVEVARQTSQHS